MHDEIVLAALRAQAWQRAKGELRAMLEAHHSPNNIQEKADLDKHAKRYNMIYAVVEAFINAFENEGYHE